MRDKLRPVQRPEEVRDIVRAERQRRNLSLSRAGALGGISGQTWANYEASAKLTKGMKTAIAKAFSWPHGWEDAPPVEAQPPSGPANRPAGATPIEWDLADRVRSSLLIGISSNLHEAPMSLLLDVAQFITWRRAQAWAEAQVDEHEHAGLFYGHFQPLLDEFMRTPIAMDELNDAALSIWLGAVARWRDAVDALERGEDLDLDFDGGSMVDMKIALTRLDETAQMMLDTFNKKLGNAVTRLPDQVAQLAGEVQRLQRVQEAEMGEIEDPAELGGPNRAAQ
jgi:hypothetical protein